MTLRLFSEGPILRLADSAERPRLSLFVSREGAPGLGLWDAQGRARMGLSSDITGAPKFSLADATERTRILLLVSAEGAPALNLFDGGGQALFKVP